MAHYHEPSHLDLQCLSSCLLILNMIRIDLKMFCRCNFFVRTPSKITNHTEVQTTKSFLKPSGKQSGNNGTVKYRSQWEEAIKSETIILTVAHLTIVQVMLNSDKHEIYPAHKC